MLKGARSVGKTGVNPIIAQGFLFVLFGILTSPDLGWATDGPCARVLELRSITKAAKQLDGQIVCMRAMLRPISLDRQLSSRFYEFVRVGGPEPKSGGTLRVGLIDWDKELGIDESLYRPQSYDLLEKAAKTCGAAPQNNLTFEVVVKGVVEYGKKLVARAAQTLPSQFQTADVRKFEYGTELVLLEFLRAKPICRQ
jgi:hypothetical protein